MKYTYCLMMVFLLLISGCGKSDRTPEIFAKENLMAWCIVPYDAKERGPEERAQMLKELGITMLAYDWREEHIPTFDDEWEALQRHGITLQAVWLVSGRDPENDNLVEEVFNFIERNHIETQLWTYIVEGDDFDAMEQDEKINEAGQILSYIADRAQKTGSKVGLYNHRGWFGEPENQLNLIEHLDRRNVGIVYNFHHGVGHHEKFKDFFPLIEPHLLAVNLAGIKNTDSLSFYGVGEGEAEYDMIRIMMESNYTGPVGIINHDHNRDAKEGLVTEMNGLRKVLDFINNTSLQ